jgi:hypothetical protein
MRIAIGCLVGATALGLLCAGATGAKAARATECTAIDVCYCVEADLKPAIEANVAKIRALIAEQRAAGKAIGYMSVPLSTVGGGYFGLNNDVALQTKAKVEKRLGANSAWLLNPGMRDFSLPSAATGADYMLQWTRVLEGVNGLGEDFDFVYFVGPADFASALGLTGEGDMEKIDALFEQRIATDEGLRRAVAQGRLTKASFRNYYALRASIVFSYGSHDEWNIARVLNERRRGAAQFGIANQIALFYDGHPVPPAAYEETITAGNAGRCAK